MTMAQSIFDTVHASYGALAMAFAGVAAAVGEKAPTGVILHPHWKAFDNLHEFSDADLQDIGLTRGDLEEAENTPRGADPTAELARIREARMGF